MKKSVLVFEDDPDLKENIAELIQLNGFPVKTHSPVSLETISQEGQNAIAICNASTIVCPIESFISLLKKKVAQVIVLCTDLQDPRISEADEKIVMPFDEKVLVTALQNCSSPTKKFFKNDTLKSVFKLTLTGI
ncbi:hypothetical protein [Ekhidna sp.]